MGAVYRVVIEKQIKDTGHSGKPFYVKEDETTRIYLFGILIKKVEVITRYPDERTK